MSRKVIGVAVGIIIKNGDILCCQRKRNTQYALQWEFPGGKIRPNETPEECLRRELTEELNITALRIEPYEIRLQKYPDGGIFEVNYFLVRNFSGNLINNAFEEIRWVHPRQFNSMRFLDGNKPVIKRLVDEFDSSH